MITEDYVSFEVAKLLKESGFDENTPVNYFVGDDRHRGCVVGEMIYHKRITEDTHLIACPTLQMAMKWLREKDEILISVNPTIDKDGFICIMYYIWQLDDIDVEATKSGLYSIENYNNCINDAIKYCLENLI